MMYTLALLASLSPAAPLQDDVWKSLARGDRVQITLLGGATVLGHLDARPAPPGETSPPLDYTLVSEITLDVSFEYPGLHGTMTFSKSDIKDVRKLTSFDASTLQKLKEEQKTIDARIASDEERRREDEARRDKTGREVIQATSKGPAAPCPARSDETQKDLEKGVLLLKRFPPEKYGPQSLQELTLMKLRHQVPPADLVDFADPETQRLWNLALRALQAAQASPEAERPAPGGSPK